MNEKTLEAVRLIADLCRANGGSVSPYLYQRLTEVVQTAVDAERERCCSIIESHRNHKGNLVPYAQSMLDKIRGSKP